MKFTLKNILKNIITENPKFIDDEMLVYYEYTKYCGVPILKFPKLFVDKEYRKSLGIRPISTVSRELRKLKRGE